MFVETVAKSKRGYVYILSIWHGLYKVKQISNGFYNGLYNGL